MNSMELAQPFDEYYFLEQRVQVLEDLFFKKKKKEIPATKSQKLLLLKDLGILDSIDKVIPGRNKKALLLSILLDENEFNIRKDLSNINLNNSLESHVPNLEFALNVYKNLELKELSEKTDTRINLLQGKPRSIKKSTTRK